MNFKYITQDEREMLYEELWRERLDVVATKYNISDTTLRKHAKRLMIPLPPRGHWIKVDNGEGIKRIELPRVTGSLKKHVRNYAIKYRTDIDELSDNYLSSNEELHLLRAESKKIINDICSHAIVSKQLRNPHPLITEHKEEIKFRIRRKKESNKTYNQILNSKIPVENIPILPIQVSNSSTNRAYRIIDTFVKSLNEIEGYTRVEIKDSKDTAFLSVMYTFFHFEMKEKANNLVLSIVAEDWIDYNGTRKETIEFKDMRNTPLEEQVGSIIYKMFVIANRFYAKSKLEERIEDREWKERERKRKLEQMRKGELEEVKQLSEVASDWNKAREIRSFVDAMEVKLQQITDKRKKEKLINWIEWAKGKADWLDPLTEKQDELLGESIDLLDRIYNDKYF